jgi:ferrous iron transport protein B
MSNIKVGLVGNPNCGKTTLFNRLTGARQKVGNWAGVTVDKKSGIFNTQQYSVELIDLPGVYSLTTISGGGSIDENIACEFILQGGAQLFINIIDAANLERNLYLTLQLLEMRVPVVLVVNMIDIAQQRGLTIDTELLGKQLGCPIVAMTANKGRGLEELKAAIDAQVSVPPAPVLSLDSAINQAITELLPQLAELPQLANYQSQLTAFALRLLEGDAYSQDWLADTDALALVEQQRHTLEKQLGEELDIVIADARYHYISGLVEQVMSKRLKGKQYFSQKLDAVLLNRWLGLPIFLFIMYLMFEFSMNIGTLLQPLFQDTSDVIFIQGVAYLGHSWGLPPWLIAVFANGIGFGIYTVLSFVPQIGLLFLFLAFLEDFGYMARAAFVMDRLMQSVGLPGKSFVPLIVGFGCNVPGIMATRTLEKRRDRVLTSMMSPFMSCGARLAIFVVFATAFFPAHGGFMLFLLYIIGIIVAIGTGLLLKYTVLDKSVAPFVMELPVYHFPYMKSIFIMTWQRLRGFLLRAGKVIVPVCLLVGSLNAIQLDGTIHAEGSQDSILSVTGRAITPILHPLGVEQNNWPAAVGLITGTLAKEVVVGTLNTLYSQPQAMQVNTNYSLWEGLDGALSDTWDGLKTMFNKEMLNPFTANEADHHMSQLAMGKMSESFPSQWAAFAYLLFVLLYIPCVSTIGALNREVGKGWAWLSTIWSFAIAYVVAVGFYQSVTWYLHPYQSTFWLLAIAAFLLLCYWGLKYWDRYSTRQLIPISNVT